jgi:hypothetical protein
MAKSEEITHRTGEICIKYSFNKGLISRVYKELKNSTAKKSDSKNE